MLSPLVIETFSKNADAENLQDFSETAVDCQFLENMDIVQVGGCEAGIGFDDGRAEMPTLISKSRGASIPSSSLLA